MSNIDALKIKKDIADLKDKKQTLLYSLESDIKAIDAVIKDEYCQIGQHAYILEKDGKDSMAELGEAFERVDKCKADQEAKRKKMGEISERYDDEITMLEKLIPPEPAPAEAPAGGAAGTGFCSNCGKPSTSADKFCMGCGTKL